MELICLLLKKPHNISSRKKLRSIIHLDVNLIFVSDYCIPFNLHRNFDENQRLQKNDSTKTLQLHNNSMALRNI